MNWHDFLYLFTVGAYLCIAVQFYISYLVLKKSKNFSKKALVAIGAMIFIFLLYAITGYLAKVFIINHSTHIVIHFILNICSTIFIMLNQVNVIMLALSKTDD